jgi:hypothetical protein
MITSATARRNKPIGRKIHLWKREDMDALRRGYTELATTFCQTSMQQVQFKICGPSLRLIYINSKTVFSVRSPLIKPQNLLGFSVESGLIMFVM